MAKFTDNEGREWRVKVTLPLLKEIRDEINLDLGRPQQFIAMSGNPIDFVNAMYIICRKQCIKRKIGEEGFGASLTGDAIEECWNAFEKAYLDFCPSRQRKILRRMTTMASKAEELNRDQLEAIFSRVEDSYKPATNSPLSSESIPLDSHSGN